MLVLAFLYNTHYSQRCTQSAALPRTDGGWQSLSLPTIQLKSLTPPLG
jgi:hypothetical protein